MMKTIVPLALVVSIALLAVGCDDDADGRPSVSDAGGEATTEAGARGEADAGPSVATDASSAVDAGGGGDAGGDAGPGCLSGGAAATPTGSGTCAAPYVIDLSGVAIGTTASHTFTGGADEASFTQGGSCTVSFAGTARDVVYHVLMPNAVTALEIGVDSAGSADARVAVAEDPSCQQPLNACANAGAAGACEGLVAPRGGFGFFGTETYVVVSESTSSGQPLTVTFKTK